MRRFATLMIALALVALVTPRASSYVRSVNTGGLPRAWNLTSPSTTIVANGRITYNINSAGYSKVPFAEVEQALNASFKTWEDIPTCTVAFTEGATTTVNTVGQDGVFPLFWLEDTNVINGQNMTGVLALTFTSSTIPAGAQVGELIKATMVFNGKDYTWATNGDPSSIDIAEVATHEIGHSIGLNHSPVASATMFPRTGFGVTKGRSLSPDDQIAASIIYPTPEFLASTGTIRGNIRDGGAANIFGAHVVVMDSNGNVVTGRLSQPDGSYAIPGLNPGSYTVFAQPLNPSGSSGFFTNGDIGGANGFYGGINTDFQTAASQNTTVTAGAETVLDFTVSRVAPAMQIKLIRRPGTGSFFSSGATINQGQTSVIVGVSGSGLPTSGSPLSISGPGVTISSTSFGSLSSGDPAISAVVNIASDAPPGARNIVINNGSEQVIATGALEILGNPSAVVSVSAASYLPATLAAGSITAAFGVNLATGTQAATSIPLPTSLAGTSVQVNGVLAPLFFVSPGQINYQIPDGTVPGLATVTVTSGSGIVSTGTMQIAAVAPGLFAANATGTGVAAAVALRAKADGTQSYEAVAQYDGTQFVSRPLDLGPGTDQVFLILYGTGIRNASSLAAVTALVGGQDSQVLYAGPAGGFVGLDQINVRLPRTLIGRGEVNVMLTVDGKQTNSLKINIQ